MKHEFIFNNRIRSSTFIVPHKHNKNAEDFLFNRLSLLSFIKNNAGGFAVLCLCLCGNFHSPGVLSTSLFSSLNHKSYHMESASTSNPYKRLESIYSGMLSRCLNPNNTNFAYYGGRGITLCIDWIRNKNSFFEWALQNGYSSDKTIDRVIVDKGYYPANCQWATSKEQMNNRRNTIRATINGETKLLSEWCSVYGRSVKTTMQRIRLGWNVEDALSIDRISKQPIVYHNGIRLTERERDLLLKYFKQIIDRDLCFAEVPPTVIKKEDRVALLAQEINERLSFFEIKVPENIGVNFQKLINAKAS